MEQKFSKMPLPPLFCACPFWENELWIFHKFMTLPSIIQFLENRLPFSGRFVLGLWWPCESEVSHRRDCFCVIRWFGLIRPVEGSFISVGMWEFPSFTILSKCEENKRNVRKLSWKLPTKMEGKRLALGECKMKCQRGRDAEEKKARIANAVQCHS